jgi:mono/diheme cytochrome c family protein
MKRFFKLLGIAVLALVVLAGTGLAFLTVKKPAQRPAPSVTLASTPEKIARGEYLSRHVTMCAECHTPHLKDRFAFPAIASRALQGDTFFARGDGFPGVLAAPNLTPDPVAGIGGWSDGEVLRAMREGVDREGKAIFPMMPYNAYHSLSDEDADAILAYVRSVPPSKNQTPRRELPFLLSLLIKSAPAPLSGPVAAPRRDDPVAYGGYLATVAGCRGCHTPVDGQHRPIAGRAFSGGQAIDLPGKQRAVSMNITPHPDTFIGKATKAEFIGRFRSFIPLQGENAPVAPRNRQTPMPWTGYAEMSDADLGAIYDYLKTVPPIENKVEKFPFAPAGP